MKKNGKIQISLFIAIMVLTMVSTASAGWMDKLNQATEKINQASQRMEQTNQMRNSLPSRSGNNGTATKFSKTPTDNPLTGEWGTQVTCAGPNTATCQNGMDNLVNCMNQSKGYYYRLVAAKLEDGLNNTPDLSAQDRRDLKADIAAVKEAITTSQVVDPDPKNPQRWLSWLGEEDQQEINRLNSKYMNEVRTDCDTRFGGMSQFSGGR
jgi:hypothetical protein